jgi:hypothetical protein
LAEKPAYEAVKKQFSKWLPTEEAPQVASGLELYNVVDADSPKKNIRSYKRYVKQYKEAGLNPPLD